MKFNKLQRVLFLFYFFILLCGSTDLLTKFHLLDMSQLDYHTQNYFVIKSNFKGSVMFKPSDRFLVEFNVTAATINELHAINYSIHEDYDVVTLNVQKEKLPKEGGNIRFVGLFVVCVALISFSSSLVYVFWLKNHKAKEEEAEIVLQDSSQAPLLEMSSAQSSVLTAAKTKKSALQQMQTDESCVSSEDDCHDNSLHGNHPDNHHHDNHLPRKTPAPPRPPCNTKDALEMEAFNNSYHTETLTSLPGPDHLSSFKHPHDQFLATFSLGSAKAIRKGGQYVQIAPGDRKFDAEVDTTLRPEGDIPDVLCTSKEEGEVRSQYITLPYPPQMLTPVFPSDSSDNRSLRKNTGSLTKQGKGVLTFNSPRSSDNEKSYEDQENKSGTKIRNASSLKKSKPSPKSQTFHPPLNRPTPLDGGFHFSPLSSGTDRSSDSGRMTDEAYGTLGSTVSNNTTSTGSDSSGSVVTVIAAESDNVRRMLSSSNSHFGIKPIISNPNKETSSTLPSLKKEGKPTVRFSNQTPTTSSRLLNTSLLIITGMLVTAFSLSPLEPSIHPEVHLIIHVPPSTPIATTDLYVNRESHVSVVNLLSSKAMKVNVYDIEPSESLSYDDACKDKSCDQACDQSTGQCVCRRGYELNEDEQCEDIDECQRLEQPCHIHAKCTNKEGNFTCECERRYHGDGFHCQSCDQPCAQGSYETQSCQDGKFKNQVCKKCSEACKNGFYISENCSRTKDIKCSRCRSECSYMDFEFKPCVGAQNRECQEIRSLPVPKISNNMMLENRKEVSPVSSYRLQYDGTNRNKIITLRRTTGYGVRITLKEANLAPLYQAVDHSDSNDNADLKGGKMLLDYCPYPIPEKYNLTLKMWEGITTKAAHHTCGMDKKDRKKKKRASILSSIPDAFDDLDVCSGESGFFPNPDERCETYMRSGKMPDLNKNKASVVCVKASRLTDLFDVSHKFDDMSTTFLDTNGLCANRRMKCDDCLRNCAKKMVSYKGSNSCNVTAEDADNGESPRLQYCYSCCNKKECSEDCEVYYDKSCPQIRCITGNIAEITMEPVFSADTHAYACHIQPVPNYVIYDFDFVILKGEAKLNNKIFHIRRFFNESHGHPYQAEDHHEFLKIKFGSLLSKQPNILRGSIAPSRSGVGYYKTEGKSFDDGRVLGKKSVLVKPVQPFAVNRMSWKDEGCDSDVLSRLVRGDSESFREVPNIYVKKLGGFKYGLVNKTQQDMPHMTFTIPADMSILSTTYGLTTVKDDRTLRADLVRTEMFWELVVEGEVITCPGSFNIEIRDPLHAHTRMFDVDTGLACPPTFSLAFTIPADTPDRYNKTFLVDIRDAHRTIKMTVFRPYYEHSANDAEFFRTNRSLDTARLGERKREEEIVLMTSPVVVLCVLVVSLAVVLLVGIVTENEGLNEDKLNSCQSLKGPHYFFIVCYVTFKTTYSVLVTFTFLVIIIKHFNQDSVEVLGNYRQLVDTANHMQKLDIQAIQAYVRQEVRRQNDIANQTKHHCHLKLTDLQEQLERAKETMEVTGPNHTAIHGMAMQYTRQVVRNLTKIVNQFKKEFTTYANKALEKLKRSIVQTSSAIESSKWMDGPRIIYEAVKAKRSKLGMETKPFLQWAGIKQEVDRLVADMSLKDFPLPNLTEFINSESLKPTYKPLKIPKTSEVILPQNQWYYQFDKKPEKQEVKEKQSPQEVLENSTYLSFTTFQIILLVIDLVWFIHRMAGTVCTVRQIVQGCPVYISCHFFNKNDKMDSGTFQQSQDDPPSKRSKFSSCLYYLRDVNFKIMSTDFIPKMVASVTTGCLLYIGMAASDKLISLKSLSNIGYFDALMGPMEASYSLAATSVKLNAHKINSFELPLYEQLINIRYKRYQLLLDMYEEVLHSSAVVRDSEHCMWKQLLKPGSPCECSRVRVEKLKFEGCLLPRVLPHAYQKFRRADVIEHKRLLSLQTLPYLDATRRMAANTGLSIALFVLVLSLIDLLNNVVWIYFKRFNLLKVMPLFEIERIPFLEEQRE